MTSSDPTTAPSTSVEEVVPDESAEDQRAQRRALAAVWLAAGSALAAMIAVGWYGEVRNGSQPPGGDMTGHAAAAEWLRHPALVGLARLVGLVLRRSGHRRQLPAARSCPDALHPSGTRTVGSSRCGAAGAAAVGHDPPNPSRGLCPAPTTSRSRRSACARGRVGEDALGPLGVPQCGHLFWFVAGDVGDSPRIVLCRMGRALRGADGVWSRRRRGDPVQRHGRAWCGRGLPRTSCHQRRLIPQRGALGNHRRSSGTCSVCLVVGAVRGGLGSPRCALAGSVLQRMGDGRRLAGRGG